MRVIYRVHGYATHFRPQAFPTRAPGFSKRNVLMLNIANLSHRRPANERHTSHFPGRHTQLSIISLLGNQLCERSGRPGHLPALSGTQFYVMDLCAQRNIDKRQRVPGKNIGFGPAHNRFTYFKTRRGNDVALLAVEVRDQGDVSRTIWIVFNLADTSGHAFLVTLKINDAIKTLVTAATTTNRDSTVVVPPRNSLLRFEQRLFGYRPEGQLIARQVGLITPRRGCGCKFLYAHEFISDFLLPIAD